MNADQQFLFGVLALQDRRITIDQFREIFRIWSSHRSLDLPDLLLARGWITADAVGDLLSRLTAVLDRHGGDVRAGLGEFTTIDLNTFLGELSNPDQTCMADVPLLVPGPDHPAPVSDRYSLERIHARGGVGQIWLARDRLLGRDVALKELRPEKAGHPQARQRFLEEAKITSQLEHPGVVPIYELCLDNGNTAPYYTMRFIRGRTLRQASQEFHRRRRAGQAGPLELPQLLWAFVSVCNTVAYAHSRGVLHRDLKGANVVLGDYGEVLVLDWGVAKLFTKGDEPGPIPSMPDISTNSAPLMLPPTTSAGFYLGGPGSSPQLSPPSMPSLPNMPPIELEIDENRSDTRDGQLLGTPTYMAPEQAAGRTDLVDVRTDVYGLGAVLYEILTGLPPHMGQETSDVLWKARHGRTPEVQAREPWVPEAIHAICRKAIARRKARRYASALDLADDVRRFLADEPVRACPEPWNDRARRWLGRHRGSVTIGFFALMLVLLASLGGSFYLLSNSWERERDERARTDEAREEARLARYVAAIRLGQQMADGGGLDGLTPVLDGQKPLAGDRDLRGFEWYLLSKRVRRAADGGVQNLTLPDQSFLCVALSPEGKRVAAGCADGAIALWDLPSGAPRLLKRHKGEVTGVDFSPDGQRLVSVGHDGLLLIWDLSKVTAGEVANPREIRAHALPIRHVAHSPDGKWLCTAAEDQQVKVWVAAAGVEVATFKSHRATVRSAVFRAGDNMVISGDEAGLVKMWDPNTLRELVSVKLEPAGVHGLQVSPDGRRLVTFSKGKTVQVWRASSLAEGVKPVWSFTSHRGPVRGLAFSPDGARLASVDGDVKLWELGLGQEVLSLPLAQPAGTGIAFASKGGCLAACTSDGGVRIWRGNE